MSKSPGLVIHWFPYSQRSTTLAGNLGYRVHLLRRAGSRRPWSAPFTYPLLAAQTVWLMARWRPAGIVVVAPPFVAPFVVLCVGWFMRVPVAIDIHSGALLDRRWRWSTPLLAWACRRARATVVTLPSLQERLRRHGVQAIVVPDPLPDLRASAGRPRARQSEPLVVGVCGWGEDEPVEDLIEAARGCPWQLRLTGSPRRTFPALPDNVQLTGFLEDTAYAQLLADADLVVVLTRRDETLLSGAWEALALGRPLVVSATPTLIATFGTTIASIGMGAENVRSGIEEALGDGTRAAASADLAQHFRRENARALAELRQRLMGPKATR